MKLLEKLKEKKKKMQEQIKKGREVTEQQRAEKLRDKRKKLISMKPGARKAITEGLLMNKKVTDVMKDEYSRRKYERQIKYQKGKK
jgi:hypothetical protein